MADFTAWVEQNKALWSRVYDEVIQPSLEKEWNKREETHQHQLKEKEKSHEMLLEHLNNEILKSARLSKENSQLKAEVQSRGKMLEEMKAVARSIPTEEHRRLLEEHERLKQQLAKHNTEASSLHTEHKVTKEIEPTILEDESHDLAQKFSELSKKYDDAAQQVKYLQRKNATVMQKNKDMKDSVRAWQEYADRQSGKRRPKVQPRIEEGRLQPLSSHALPEDHPDIPSSPGVLPTLRTSPVLTDPGRSSPVPSLPQATGGTTHQSTSLGSISNRQDQSLNTTGKRKLRSGINDLTSSRLHDMSEHFQGVPFGIQRVISDHDNLQQAHPSSSQTTVDEHGELSARHEQTINIEEDDDMPEFVSERSLKRKRREASNSRFEIYADRSSDGTPVRPYRVKEEQCSSPPISVYKLLHQETTMDLDDPTLNLLQTPRHNRRRLSIPAAGTEVPRRRRCNSAPLTQDIKIEKETEQDLVHDDLIGWTAESRVLPVVESIETGVLSEPKEPAPAKITALKAIDPNIVSNVSEEPPNKRSRQSEARHGQKHGFLLESGEDLPPLSNKPSRPSSARARINQRVRSLHNLQTPSKSSPKTPQADSVTVKIEQVPTPPSSSRTIRTPGAGKNSSKPPSKPRPDSREYPTPDRPIWTMKPPETRSSARKSRALQSKEQGRLREKPITELNIQDFKPNPGYNQGYSYAFSETVRKRGDRMCLPGCTNPQCCGSTFRTFAEAQAPLSASQEEALLEDYLGEAYNTMQLTQMSSDERKELVLQARTRKMAKESGKHREAYERRKTPPGFWRVDFPTTQEQQEDRERAKEQEKAEIRERWIEAQRKGGKWVFRDE